LEGFPGRDVSYSSNGEGGRKGIRGNAGFRGSVALLVVFGKVKKKKKERKQVYEV